MNSVANQMVAMMNSNFSTGLARPGIHRGQNNFQNLLKQVNIRHDEAMKKQEVSAVVKNEEAKTENVETEELEKEKPELVKPKEVSSKGKNQATKKVDSKMDKFKDKSLEDIEKEVLETVSDELNITEDELKSILAQLNLTPLDLFQPQQMKLLIENVMGIDDLEQLLTSKEFIETFKQVENGIKELLQKLDMNRGQVISFNQMLKQSLGESSSDGNSASTDESSARVNPSTTMTTAASADATQSTTESVDFAATLESSVNTVEKTQNENLSQSGQGDNLMQQMMSQSSVKDSITSTVVEEIIKQSQTNLIDTKDSINQIVTKINIQLKPDSQTMQLQLQPENLGKIAVSITTEAGVVKGQFIAENQLVKESLETNMIQLKEQLTQQGIKVEKMEVILGNSSQFFNQKENQEHQMGFKQNKRGRIRRLEGIETNLSTIDIAQEKINRQALRIDTEKHTVEYSA